MPAVSLIAGVEADQDDLTLASETHNSLFL